MKIIVGLGNPGNRYAGTRHNVGFVVLDALARRDGSGGARQRFEGRVLETSIEGERCLLLWPQTFMNRSGQCVRAARDFYQIDPADLLVICDDFNLPLGRLRWRTNGSAGGQKGLEDTIRHLGTQAVPRLRIGVGPVPAGWDPADFVLGRFTQDETETVAATVARAVEAVVDWVRQGIQYCMNHYNAGPESKPKSSSKEKQVGDERV